MPRGCKLPVIQDSDSKRRGINFPLAATSSFSFYLASFVDS
jgi:hypothetical protein